MSIPFLISALLFSQVVSAPPDAQLRREAFNTLAQQIGRQPPLAPILLTAQLTHPDGSRRGPAVNVAEADTRLHVWSAQGSCDVTMSAETPDNPREGWRVSMRVVERPNRTVVVQVEWQRAWVGGQMIQNGARATTEVTLRSGDRVPLDHVEVAAPGLECHRLIRSLEVSMLSSAITIPPNRPVMPPPTPMRLEVWLVHVDPAGTEVTYPASVHFDPADTRMVFRTRAIVTPDGTYHLDVDAQLRAIAGEDGQRALWAGIRRIVVDTSTDGVTTAGAASRILSGTGVSVVDWVTPGEVLSFDFPPIFGGGGRGGVVGGRAGEGGGGAVGGGVGAPTSTGGRGASGTHTFALGRYSSAAMPPLRDHRFSLRLRFVAR